MKVFNLTLEFDLDEYPEWIVPFRQKYKEPYQYHITLKYPTYIQEKEIPELKELVRRIAKKSNPFVIEFDKYYFGKTENGYLIMVHAKHDPKLFSFQKDIVKRLNKFGQSLKPTYKEYESDFRPHMALARKLSDGTLKKAKNELEEKIYCKAKIDKLALVIVDENYTVQDIIDTKNTTYYYLSQE